jgi:RNA polymerase sigma factor (sigma-70 family)
MTTPQLAFTGPAPAVKAGTCRRPCCTVSGVAERSTVKPGTLTEIHPARVQTAEIPAHRSAGRCDEEMDDATLAQAGMIGQAWSHREIWYRFAPMVYSVLRRTLGARHDQEDLLQEVFLRVFRRLATLQNPAALRSFVYSFAIRVVREELRRHRLHSKFASLFAATSEPCVPHEDFESRELLSRIQSVMDRMSGRKRAVFVLRRFDGMELAEIASNLDLSLSTVKRDLEQADEFIARSIHRDEHLRGGLEAKLPSKTGGRARESNR